MMKEIKCRNGWAYGKKAAPNRSLLSISAQQLQSQVIEIQAQSSLAASDSLFINTYTIYGDGSIIVGAWIEPKGALPNIPRLGMQMAIPEGYDHMTWYGRGPQETYWDRKTGAAVGRYKGLVNDQIHHYTRPQENGNKTDVRWISFTNQEGAGFAIVGMPHVDVSAWPYTMKDLEQAAHPFEIPERDFITINIDYRQMGVGGDNSWGMRTHPEYTLPANRPYGYRFQIRPLNQGDTKFAVK